MIARLNRWRRNMWNGKAVGAAYAKCRPLLRRRWVNRQQKSDSKTGRRPGGCELSDDDDDDDDVVLG